MWQGHLVFQNKEWFDKDISSFKTKSDVTRTSRLSKQRVMWQGHLAFQNKEWFDKDISSFKTKSDLTRTSRLSKQRVMWQGHLAFQNKEWFDKDISSFKTKSDLTRTSRLSKQRVIWQGPLVFQNKEWFDKDTSSFKATGGLTQAASASSTAQMERNLLPQRETGILRKNGDKFGGFIVDLRGDSRKNWLAPYRWWTSVSPAKIEAILFPSPFVICLVRLGERGVREDIR
jgi:hypothetical protein